MVFAIDRFHKRSSERIAKDIIAGQSVLIHHGRLGPSIPCVGCICLTCISKLDISSHSERSTGFSKLMVVDHTHRCTDLLLQTSLTLITIINTHRITVKDIVIVLLRSRVGIVDLWTQDQFVHWVDLILHFQTHLRIPRVGQFDGRIAVDISCLLAIALFVRKRTGVVVGVIHCSIATQKQGCFLIAYSPICLSA